MNTSILIVGMALLIAASIASVTTLDQFNVVANKTVSQSEIILDNYYESVDDVSDNLFDKQLIGDNEK